MGFARSLSGRLLMLTIATVMVVEVLVFLPSVARYRLDFLQERLRMSALAAMAASAAPDGGPDPALSEMLLYRAGVESVALRREDARALALSTPEPGRVGASHDLREDGPARLVLDALGGLIGGPERIRVIGETGSDGLVVEITLPTRPLREAMRAFGWRILGLSLVISVATAVIVYLLARLLLVRPLKRLGAAMASFRQDPENPARVIRPASRLTEVAEAEAALAELQSALREALRARGRLAALGEAVAKIAHDLRNMLATAQLVAADVEASRDPVMRRLGPKLIAALDRAVGLCERTLRYGRVEEAAPEPRRVALAALLEEAVEAVFPDRDGRLTVELDAPPGLVALADKEQLFRVLVNLLRNARQALEGEGRPGRVAVSARPARDGVEIEVVDDGPGLPAKALDNLFRPFHGGARRGGAGLGLAIAHELATLQGGRLELARSDTSGTAFRLTLPPP